MSSVSGIRKHTVGVLRWVLDRTMSKKSAAVGTGAMALSPLVDMVKLEISSTGVTCKMKNYYYEFPR